ncbi:MAG: hypothetical protein OHK93_004594 [Ramalina farinacea]|uniref:Uncharacterized protein n=1 Tax=Ramalina farinacea TaxID=258253 RepID=A0AA43TV71_9LECA|nr:hypothetical protein [Ramalina farinacea]
MSSDWGPHYASPQEGGALNHHGPRMVGNQDVCPPDPTTHFREHQGQAGSGSYDVSRLAEPSRAVDCRPSVHTGSRHRLLETTPPPDGVEWTRKAANAHGIDPEVMRIIIWNMSADEFEDILAHYRGGRAYRATHRILAVYIRYHMKVPTAQEFSMVMKADAPFEEFALNTSPSGLFWTDWQNSHTLNEWRLVALAIFLKLGEEKAAHRTEESKPDCKDATNANDEHNGELSDDTLEDASHQLAPQDRLARGSATDPRCATMRTASGHLSSSERGGRDEKKGQAYSDHGYNSNVLFSWPRGYQDDWGFYYDGHDFF